jgi:hypothetical protein
MPVNTLDPDPTIEIIFRGVIITHIIDGRRGAQLGAVKDAPCHEPKIRVIERSPDGTQEEIADTSKFNLEEDIFLDVENTRLTRVWTFQRKETKDSRFDRFNEREDKNDFRLHIDLERDIYKGKQPAVDKSMLGPVFSVQSAIFLTRQRTDKKLAIQRRDGTLTPLGFAAQEIAAQVSLTQLHSKAILRNGSNVLLTVDACNVVRGSRYVIEFDCECADTAPVVSGAAAGKTDFSLVHNAVGKNLTEDERVDIVGEATDGGPVDPQVFCMGGNTSQPLR